MRARQRHALLAAAVLATASGCVHPAAGKAMAIGAADAGEPPGPAVANAVAVGEVTGGKRSLSSIDPAELRIALRDSLRAAGMLAEGPGAPLSLEARILDVGQGEGGGVFDSAVRTEIRYTVRETRSGGAVIDEVITATHLATAGDALVGSTRHVLAVEGSARKNVAALVKRLRTIQRKAPGAAPARSSPAG